mgnify:CR=1 FL=1
MYFCATQVSRLSATKENFIILGNGPLKPIKGRGYLIVWREILDRGKSFAKIKNELTVMNQEGVRYHQ